MTPHVHLHVRSHFAVPGSGEPVDRLVTAARANGSPAMALTDPGILTGIPDLARACRTEGIQPIVGMELTQEVLSDDRVVLLAQNGAGFRSISRLSTRLQCEPGSGADAWEELLHEGAPGLICLSGCRESRIHRELRGDGLDAARGVAGRYLDVFGPERFFLQLERPEPGSERVIDVARAVGARVVATCDVRRVAREGAGADAYRYLRRPVEMEELYRDVPEAISASLDIAGSCIFRFPPAPPPLPVYPMDGGDPVAYLRGLATQGVTDRPPLSVPAMERLDQELHTIEGQGESDLYLVAWDLARYARQAGIAISHLRGGASGSLVLYRLGVTEVDPLRHGLLHDPRGLRLELEVDPDRRAELGAHLRRVLGEDRLARLATFRFHSPRSALEKAARLEGRSAAEALRISRLAPLGCSTIDEAVARNPRLRRWPDRMDRARIMLRARSMEHVVLDRGVHASAVGIRGDRITDHVPLTRDATTGEVVTQYAFDDAVSVGLTRVDILGLAEAAVAAEGLALAGVTRAPEGDERTMEMLRAADTGGVWLLESTGARRLLREARPRSFDDLVLLLGLGYPCPAEIASRVARRMSGREPTVAPFAAVRDVLAPTYGELRYREQVLQIIRLVAGLDYEAGDRMRRALGAKEAGRMAEAKELFVRGAVQKGHALAEAHELFGYLAAGAGPCGFKADAVARCGLVYRLAWLKANHPAALARARGSVKERADRALGRPDRLLQEGGR